MPTDPVPPVSTHAAGDPTPYRRSLRASRTRRDLAARRTRRVSRGRRTATGALVVLGLLTGGAVASPATRAVPEQGASSVAAAQAVLGITADGVVGPVTRRAVRAFQRSHSLIVDGIIGPRTLAALGVTGRLGTDGATRRSSVLRDAAATSGASPLLESIALCESGGDPTSVSSSGRYRGKYQFDRQTWRSVGGSGDPAAAPEAEQDRRAARLLDQRGTSAWPACSKQIGA